jgi:diguanylate cyclase (GGDEF)-like protein/PAS domain S-box-containing protein
MSDLAGPPVPLYRSIVEDAFEFVVTIGPDLTVRFANQALTRLLGRPVDEVVGRGIQDFVHPDDFERALLAVSGWERWGAPAGATSFRLRHGDGRWLTFDVTASTVTDGDGEYFAVYGRPADYQHATEAVLANLLTGASRTESLAPVVDLFEWQLNESHVAIAWYEAGVGHQFVSTGLPRELTGAEDHPGGPWLEARSTGQAVHRPDSSSLDPARRVLADEAGRGSLWVEPIDDVTSGVAALVTVWARADGPPAHGHAFGMALSHVYVELILRWTQQVTQLDAQAHTDPLTGLPNRRALYSVLEAVPSDGALLFCDLDRFKPVNDELGHNAGDEVLREVARRLSHAVRTDDLVARVGGDEFVIVARETTEDQARELADRLASIMAEPVEVAGQPVTVGITVGVAHSTGHLDQSTLDAADRDMLEAKARVRPA